MISPAPQSVDALIAWQKRQRLPACARVHGAADASRGARRVLAAVAQSARIGHAHLDRGDCRQAFDYVTIAIRQQQALACYVPHLDREQRRRVAERDAFAGRAVSDLYFGITRQCLIGGGRRLTGALGKATPHDMRVIQKIAKRQRWTIDRTRRGHWRFCPPSPEDCVITSGTPGSQRVIRHLIADLRRSGLEV